MSNNSLQRGQKVDWIKPIPEDKLPFDLEAEKNILSSAMSQETAMPLIVELKPNQFYDAKNRIIFEAILECHTLGKDLSMITVSSHLRNTGRLEAAGGAAYLGSISQEVYFSALINSVSTVRNTATLRGLIRALEQIINSCYTVGDDVPKLLASAANAVFELQRHDVNEGIVKVGKVMLELLEKLHKQATEDDSETRLPTGYPDLDRILGGLRPGALYVIAARPGKGKTALALNIATNAAKSAKKAVVIFSLEMSKQELAKRILSSEAQVDSMKLDRPKFLSDEFSQLDRIVLQSQDIPMYVDDRSGSNVAEIRAKCRKLALEQPLGLIVIDYLQLMSVPSNGRSRSSDNRQQEVAEISRSLKLLARELEVPVFALSQLNRSPEKRKDGQPTLADLRDSGAIEQDADVVMFIHHTEEPNPDEPRPPTTAAQVIVEKNRHGATDKIDVVWKASLTSFLSASLDDEYLPDEPAYSRGGYEPPEDDYFGG